MNKLAEVELMTESAGGYNFNSAIMVVMRKVAVNIQTRQINTEVTQANVRTHHVIYHDILMVSREFFDTISVTSVPLANVMVSTFALRINPLSIQRRHLPS